MTSIQIEKEGALIFNRHDFRFVALHPLSRFLIALTFLVSGAGKIAVFEQTAATLRIAGFPAAEIFLIGTIVIEIFGGLSLMLGFQTRYTATVLVAFVVAATATFHLQGLDDPVTGQNQIAHLLKNVAIIGGLLKFVSDGGGYYSLDRRFERREIVI